jgi:serine/threonine protein phosphatase PrpC
MSGAVVRWPAHPFWVSAPEIDGRTGARRRMLVPVVFDGFAGSRVSGYARRSLDSWLQQILAEDRQFGLGVS